VTGNRKSAAHEPFFDAIARVRPYGAEDRVQPRLATTLATASAHDELLVDIECWFPPDPDVAAEWLAVVTGGVGEAGGDVTDSYINNLAGIASLRVRLTAESVDAIAQLDVIEYMDVVPEPAIRFSDAMDLDVDELPPLSQPDSQAPLVAVIDSGVRSAHPLLAGAVYDAVALNPSIPDGQDRHGHGTAVAGRLVLGALEHVLESGVAPPPLCRVLSVRVLDDNNVFPEATLWAHDLEDAIRYSADQGARVVVLAIGDSGTPFRGPRSTPVASLVDQLARELGLVVVLPAGNIELVGYAQFDEAALAVYPRLLLEAVEATVLDPAPAALALTVGATVLHTATAASRLRAIGEIGWPAPYSRRGPGVAGAMKPELSAPAGTLALDRGTNDVVTDPNVACLVADGRAGSTGLITTDVGTSLAVPLVGRVAAAIVGQYPAFSSNLVRSLVLQATSDEAPAFLPSLQAGAAGKVTACRQLVGYGESRLEQAVYSSSHRVVLAAEDEIAIDGVHLYEIPIPDSFFVSGGLRTVTVSLCFDPATRSRRLDYLSSRMRFELLRGVDQDEIAALFTGGADTDSNDDVVWRDRLSDLNSRERPTLEPSVDARSAGANQLARAHFRRVLRREDGDSFLLVVQNTNRWAPPDGTQHYGLAVALERSAVEPEIYDEVRVALEAEVQPEVEVETEIRL
jgi:hypothetical protein